MNKSYLLLLLMTFQSNVTIFPAALIPNAATIERSKVNKLKETFARENFDIYERNQHGGTPLHFAANMGLKVWVQALIELGADIYAVDQQGYTPYDHAVQNGRATCAELLAAAAQAPFMPAGTKRKR